ncbi:uncharacterized protein LOC144422771 [Styela clava]
MNAFGISSLSILVSIILGVSHGQNPWVTKCVDQHELTFFKNPKKNYRQAKFFCEGIGGYLAKVDNQKMTNVINATFVIKSSDNTFYIGGNDIANEGVWKWQDGTDVIMRGEDGYQNWKHNQPNGGTSENCLTVGRQTYEWIDVECGGQFKFYYICQKKHSTPKISVNDGPPHHTKICRLENCVNKTAEWYKESPHEQVTTGIKKNGIYQIIDGSSSTLHFDNATILDIGKYYCRAHNSSKKFFDFKADGNPTITSITNSSCNRSLFVTWNPSKYAVGFQHKITANNSKTKVESFKNVTRPQSNTSVTTEILGLKATTEYHVTIVVCESDAKCSSAYSASTTVTTDGKTEPVESASLSTNCSIQWIEKNDNKPENVEALKVTKNCTTMATRANIKTSHKDSFNISMPQSFPPVPNRNCTVSIQVIGCAGLSEVVNATGYCVGKPAAPNAITKPIAFNDATDSSGIRKITVTKPDENNGLLSCLFIIVKEGSSDRNIDFSTEKLHEAQSSTTEYIAVALPVFGLTDNKKDINLGDGSKSSCNVTQTIEALSNKRRRRRSVPENTLLEGKNQKLDREKSYSVFVVSTTPCGNDICIQASLPTQLGNANAFQSWIIAVTVAGACLLIALLIMVIVIKRRKAKSESSKIDSLDEVIPTRPDNVDSASKFQNEEATTGGYAEVGLTATNENTSSTSNFQNEEESTDGYTKMAFAGTVKNVTTTQNSNPKIQTKPNTPSAPKTHINAEEDLGSYINVTAKFKLSKSSDTAISTADLEEVYNSMRKKENSQFLDQFQKILSEAAKLGGSKKFASNPDLKKKNRYKNILPFDETRVKLSPEGSGYINACYIDGHNKRRKYIATQGPLSTTVDDFWQMIIEHKCYLIVMLTKEREAGKKKCEKYWPDENKNQKFGSVLVKNVHEVNYGSFTKRSFTVKSRNEGLDVINNVNQYQFLKWPDHGAPATTSDLLRMHRAVMKSYEEIGNESPIVVHCSAGAGRTGTLIGFDTLLDESKSAGSVDAFACVLNMRKQRVEMVQNSDQYVLVHKLVLEAILFEDRDLSSDEAKAKLETIKTPDGEASIQKEFGDLNRIGPMKNSKLRGLNEKNRNVNRSKKAVPYDYTLVTIFMQQDEDEIPYMNASWVESNDESSPMIASQGPNSSNIDLFWRLVLDNNVNTIVMLTKLKEGKEEQCSQYWPTNVGEVMKWNNLSVTRISDETEASITERKIRVDRGPQSKTVTQFHYIGWKSTSCPKDGREIIDLVNKMQKNIRSAGNGVTLIHCSDGIGRTGVFCATVNLIDRLKCENRVDVFRTVKDLRDGRPNMVENLDQYKFCYQAIVEYLKSFDLYSNF